MHIVDIRGRLHDARVLSVIAHSQYMPTQEKLNAFADRCEADPEIYAFACESDGAVCGVALLKHEGNNAFALLSIATAADHRRQGVARSLISFAATALQCAEIVAETDDDAVAFYRKCGFHIASLGEKYPGVIRYRCTWNLL